MKLKLETWNYDKANPPYQKLMLVDEEKQRLVATLECDFVGDNPYVVPKFDAMAYGRLFAAAPALFAALDALLKTAIVVDACNKGRPEIKAAGFRQDLFDQARDAIALAKIEA